MGLTPLTQRSHLSSVEERLANVERLLQGLACQIDRIEGNGRDDVQHVRSGPEQEGGQLPGCFDDEDEEVRTWRETQDPTDGIGSIVFSQEDDAGYFGAYTQILC